MPEPDRPRTPDDHPTDRSTDQGFWAVVWQHKLYRDFWLLCITLAVVAGFAAIDDQQESINANRVEATQNSCDKSNENTQSINSLVTALQGIVLAGAALPGDTPGPIGVKDPGEWRTITPGPLSAQIEKQFPGFPSPDERLEEAKKSAKTLDSAKVTLRDCAADVEAVKKAAGISTSDATPTATPKTTPTATP